MATTRQPPEWHRMTRDEVDGHAAALWRALDMFVADIDDNYVWPAADSCNANWNENVQAMREALK